jgi:HK97 family phage portal protein
VRLPWSKRVDASVSLEAERHGPSFELIPAPGDVAGLPRPYVTAVTRVEALSVPAVKRARDLIAGTIGALPLRVNNAAREQIPSALLEQPEPDYARSVTLTRTLEDMLLTGRAWWRVTEFGWHGYPTKVRRLEPTSVFVRQFGQVWVSKDGSAEGMSIELVPDELLIRIDGPNEGLLTSGARAIRQALQLDQQAARIAASPRPQGVFTPVEGVDPGDATDIQAMLDQWNSSRSTNAWGYVGAALKLNPLSWTPEELQLADSRQHAAVEIARLCGLDADWVNVHTTTRTYANAETRRLDLLDFTLMPFITALEGRLSMNDVLPRGHQVKVQMSGFLRSDSKTRMETYEIGRRVGVYDDERIAELEDIPTAKAPKPAPTPVAAPVTPAVAGGTNG